MSSRREREELNRPGFLHLRHVLGVEEVRETRQRGASALLGLSCTGATPKVDRKRDVDLFQAAVGCVLDRSVQSWWYLWQNNRLLALQTAKRNGNHDFVKLKVAVFCADRDFWVLFVPLMNCSFNGLYLGR